MQGRIVADRPGRDHLRFEIGPSLRPADRGFPVLVKLGLDVLEQAEPHRAIDRAHAPVAADRGARAIALAGEEEPASLASAIGLRRAVERELALECLASGAQMGHASLVGAAAIAE